MATIKAVSLLAGTPDDLFKPYQLDAYREALDRLAADGHLFHCDCTRALLGPGGACAGGCAPRQDQPACKAKFPPKFSSSRKCPLTAKNGAP